MIETIISSLAIRNHRFNPAAIERDLFDSFGSQRYVHLAFIVSSKTNELLSYSCNCKDGLLPYKRSLHAEDQALSILINKLVKKKMEFKNIRSGINVISLRITRNNEIKLALPCMRCYKRMMRNRSLINSVLWSDDDGNIISYKLTEMDIEKLKIRDSSGVRNRYQ